MTHDIQEAFNEIMDIPPTYRRDYIIDYLRKNLPEDNARRHLFQKSKVEYLIKMMDRVTLRGRNCLTGLARKR